MKKSVKIIGIVVCVAILAAAVVGVASRAVRAEDGRRIRKAFNELGVTAFDADLNGPTATAFSPDETSAAKIFMEAVKAMPEKIVPKSAYVDNSYVGADGIKALASMPSKEELIAKMLGSMQAPIANFAGVLSAMLRGVVIALNRIAEKKGA